jgi:hypothetical protein
MMTADRDGPRFNTTELERTHNMHRQCVRHAVLVVVAVTPTLWAAADPPSIRFDMPPTAAAQPTDDPQQVSIDLRLSSMIESPDPLPIRQWIVRCVPRDESILIADYSPRTETASDLATPIQIKQCEEESESGGLAIDGAYANLTRAHAGIDRGVKNTNTIQFDRVAPMHAVTAAGTINRGNGVYFKLRWTATQVLEGEKTFGITMRVPPGWRGGLIDVSVVAYSDTKSLLSWETEVKAIGQANFVVAAFRSGDARAAELARTVSEAEQNLRRLAKQTPRPSAASSLPSMLRQFATKIDREPPPNHNAWVDRVLRGDADPYFDKQLQRLPTSIRVAVLDYVDCRDEFNGLRDDASATVVAAKRPL